MSTVAQFQRELHVLKPYAQGQHLAQLNLKWIVPKKKIYIYTCIPFHSQIHSVNSCVQEVFNKNENEMVILQLGIINKPSTSFCQLLMLDPFNSFIFLSFLLFKHEILTLLIYGQRCEFVQKCRTRCTFWVPNLFIKLGVSCWEEKYLLSSLVPSQTPV